MTAPSPEALAFECSLSFEQLFERLNELGPWTWRGTESETYGDYLVARPAEGVTVRIFDQSTRWVMQIIMRPQATVAREDIEQTLVQQILPAIGARNVLPTEGVY